MKMAEDVDLEQIASQTHGFVGSDLQSTCTEAAMQTIRERMDDFDIDEFFGSEGIAMGEQV